MFKLIRRRLLLWGVLLLTALGVRSQPRLRLIEFEDFNRQVSQVSRIVRDGRGMIWLATNDGLFRYDGYEFRSFKSRSGDGVNMTSNRISSMYPSSDGSLWCIIGGRVFLFDTRTYHYIDVLAGYERQQGTTYRVSKIRPLPCGTTWLFTDDGRVLALQDARPESTVRLMAEGETTDGMTVMCDSRQRSWVMTNRHTYLHHEGQLRRFDQTFWRTFSTGRQTWLLAKDGRLWTYEEKESSPSPSEEESRKKSPFREVWRESPITGYTELGDGGVLLFSRDGLLLLGADGQLERTAVTAHVSKAVQDKYGHLWLLDDAGCLSVADRWCRQVTPIGGVRMDDFNLHADKYGTLWFFASNGDTYYAYADNPRSLYRYDEGGGIGKISNTIYDEQGGSWFLRKGLVCRLTFESQHFKRLPMHKADMVRSVIVDHWQRLLVSTRNEGDISVFTTTGKPLGWLGRDGRISAVWRPFGAAVYSSFVDADGTLWLGTKPDGIFRLQLQEDGNYRVSQFRHDDADPQSLSDDEVYGFATDQRGRLWVGTRHGGLCCVADPRAATLRFAHASHGLKGWTASRDVGINALVVLADGTLLAGTYDGLYIADVSGSGLQGITFHRHLREANRSSSLSSSAIADVVQVSDGRIFLATEDGGLNELLTRDLYAPQLDFRHYDLTTGFPSDITRRLTEANGSLWVTTPNQLIELQLGKSQLPDVNTFLMNERPDFSVAAPACLNDSCAVFGADDGALLVNLRQLKASSFVPPLIVTGVSKEGGAVDYAAGLSDTIRLSAEERDVTIWFSALDYENTHQVVYAYRMGGAADRPWTYLGQNHSIALSQLHPGTYLMAIRSTNSDGVWADNERMLTIIVTPTFWETPWALLLVVLTIVAVTALVLYTTFYIRRLKRQQHETLEKYLALLDVQGDEKSAGDGTYAVPSPLRVPVPDGAPPVPEAAPETEADDALMKRLVGFVEENIGNSDLSIDDVAQACAVSRTSLHRKVKGMTGMAPMEFVREARIRKAVQQLTCTAKTVSEVAYGCGFTDPKYFSKCFKSATGKTPTEFKRDLPA